jgi:hypothetical protein
VLVCTLVMHVTRGHATNQSMTHSRDWISVIDRPNLVWITEATCMQACHTRVVAGYSAGQLIGCSTAKLAPLLFIRIFSCNFRCWSESTFTEQHHFKKGYCSVLIRPRNQKQLVCLLPALASVRVETGHASTQSHVVYSARDVRKSGAAGK